MKKLNFATSNFALNPAANSGPAPRWFGRSIGLLAVLLAAVALSGCGKKESADSAAADPSVTGKATPRNYVDAKGEIDLQALTQTLREYVIWKGHIPTDLNEMVTSGFLPSLPKPPAGEKYFINRGPMMYEVILINK